MIKRSMLVLGLIAAFALGLAACGSSDDTSTTAAETTSTEAATAATTDTGSSGGGEAVKVTAAADGSLAFDEKSLNASAGTVDLQLDNPSSTVHDVCVRSDSGDELGCSDTTSQGTADVSVDLAAGTYEFYCSEPGHEEAGMKGTLSVK
jgi:uncharacterized cupredoxin-like copper-binding protein